ncbi:1874_t:CDS:2, partial [Dentiscutata erythropus]
MSFEPRNPLFPPNQIDWFYYLDFSNSLWLSQLENESNNLLTLNLDSLIHEDASQGNKRTYETFSVPMSSSVVVRHEEYIILWSFFLLENLGVSLCPETPDNDRLVVRRGQRCNIMEVDSPVNLVSSDDFVET